MIKIRSQRQNRKGQSALEYLLLTAAVAALVFAGMHMWTNDARDGTQEYFEQIATGVMGSPPGPLH